MSLASAIVRFSLAVTSLLCAYDAHARFLQVDPVGHDDQINLYMYVGDDPINGSDPTGQWTTWVHNQMIRNAFPGLTRPQINTLMASSKAADAARYQTPENSFRHAMRGPSETARQAMDRTSNLMDRQSTAARSDGSAKKSNASGISPASLSAFGTGAHAAMDGTSPSHRDQNGMPYQYNGAQELPAHVMKELFANSAQMQAGVAALRDYFGKTYGKDLLSQAMTASLVNPSSAGSASGCSAANC